MIARVGSPPMRHAAKLQARLACNDEREPLPRNNDQRSRAAFRIIISVVITCNWRSEIIDETLRDGPRCPLAPRPAPASQLDRRCAARAARPAPEATSAETTSDRRVTRRHSPHVATHT